MKDQFYLVLPSNSSMKYYPENTVTHYITQLPKTLKMPGEWVVALTEIQFPRTFLHLDDSKDSNRLASPITVHATRQELKVTDKIRPKFKSPSRSSDGNFLRGNTVIKPPKLHHITIPAGIYASVQSLLDTINESYVFKNHIRFEYNENVGGLVSMRRIPDSCIVDECTLPNVVSMNAKLCRALGFLPGQSMDVHKDWKFLADYPASLSLALPDKLFVYTDICENYITGDVQTPLLRIVPVDNTNYIYGSIQTKAFSPPIYLPLLRTEFSTIEIDIRTDTGEPVPFQSGTLTATLHFKRMR